jgi:predicted nuclease of restriction endonuclease-like (RecB) superfamily
MVHRTQESLDMNDERNYRTAAEDMERVFCESRKTATLAADRAMVLAYWNIGRRIVEEERKRDSGENIISGISGELTRESGSCCSSINLHDFRKFYLCFSEEEILNPNLQNLTWIHFRSLMRVSDENARVWYMHEAAEENWSAETLERNIETRYYCRFQQSGAEDEDTAETKEKQTPGAVNSYVVAEFLGLGNRNAYPDLKSSVITGLCDFFLRMDRGYALVAREQHIRADNRDCCIDLVLYNVILKCYVLIDLTIGTVTRQDVGQIDMSVRMYDETKRGKDDNPTIGILCGSGTSEESAGYSVLHNNEHLFMSKYLTYLPTKEQLRAEIERQKNIYYLQHPQLEEEKPGDSKSSEND